MPDALLRAVAAAFALLCLALATFLAWHHPLLPVALVAGGTLWALVAFVWPGLWLFVVPALLPLIGIAPWTGWLTFEEIDILILGAAAGGYASMAVRSFPRRPEGNGQVRLSLVCLSLIVLYLASEAFGLQRGLAAAAGYRFGWFHGYGDALNSLRLSKSFAMAVLLLPLLAAELRRSYRHAVTMLVTGLVFGLGGAALSVLWERLAFVNLLDFSSDYRATGLFWEMHVGGAALDGFLALTIPFGAWALVRAQGPRQIAAALVLVGVASYACLATFSRGLYLAVPISLGIMTILLVLRGEGALGRPSVVAILKWIVALVATGVAADVVFRDGGYRSLIAVLAVVTVMLPLRSVVQRMTRREIFVASIIGAVLGAIGAVVGPIVYKGVYVFFGLVFAVCATAILRHRAQESAPWAVTALCAYVALVIAAANVAHFWGGSAAFKDTSVVLAAIVALTIWNAAPATPLWTDALRSQGAFLVAAVLVAGVVAVFSGGAYMNDRFASVQQDFAGRVWHWGDSLGILKSREQWLLGRGAGRFPADYARHVPSSEVPGAYRLIVQDGARFLALHGPARPAGSGELLRVAQRISIVRGDKYAVVLDVRAKQETSLLVEICEKNLIYGSACASVYVAVKPSGQTWRRMVVPLDGEGLAGGRWYLPRSAFFSLAVDTSRSVLDVGQVSLIGSDGRNLVRNGDWADGMARWFFTSDRQHLPWHIKNLVLALLFDHGVVGVVLFVLLVGAALWRVVAGSARHHLIAPVLAASLTGFLVVGLFDSLLDVPRVAFLFYLLTLASLVLGPAIPGNPRQTSEERTSGA